MAAAQAILVASSTVLLSPPYARAPKSPRLASHSTGASQLVSSFTRGSCSVFWVSSKGKKVHHQRTSVSVRCEQGAKQSNGLDVWLGRIAMLGFAIAITVEISTGKGLLENLGFTAPLPTVALAVTALVGALTAFFIFQSASRD
ncbi:stress enhanced protein 1, chloroplastic isoform X1 [Canna indica]|uniref:Stress enhanced protein 1, chloroplastic isoform X1 n=1 Tax=Canna indica TaxID=4628 RepID=A0AAQ3K5Z6_9LILI|nr:stress enhanced protein 1, chloroplastic isoform X1 [Canna indica]